MKKPRLLPKFRQERTISSHVAYKSSKIFVLSYYEKRTYFFNNRDVKRVTGNKQF